MANTGTRLEASFEVNFHSSAQGNKQIQTNTNTEPLRR